MNYIHGIIPDKYLSWYKENSGTFYNGKEWLVDSNDKELMDYKVHGTIKNINVMKAEALQERMIRARKKIINSMGSKGVYSIHPENIFDLIVEGKTIINYKHLDKDYMLAVTK